jgi:hypothetical protein
MIFRGPINTKNINIFWNAAHGGLDEISSFKKTILQPTSFKSYLIWNTLIQKEHLIWHCYKLIEQLPFNLFSDVVLNISNSSCYVILFCVLISNTLIQEKLVGNKLPFVLLYNFYLKYFPSEILRDYPGDVLREVYVFSGELSVISPRFQTRVK